MLAFRVALQRTCEGSCSNVSHFMKDISFCCMCCKNHPIASFNFLSLFRIYMTHDEAKDKDFELELAWVCEGTQRCFHLFTLKSHNFVLGFYFSNKILTVTILFYFNDLTKSAPPDHCCMHSWFLLLLMCK